MRKQPRVLILSLVLLGHTAAIYVLMAGVPTRADDRVAAFPTIAIRLLPMPAPGPGTRPEVFETASSVPRATDPADLPEVILVNGDLAGTALSLPPPETEPGPRERIDWASQAAQAARQWAEPDSGPMQFGPAIPGDEPKDPPRNIFESNSPRRAGYIEMIEPGVERRWISSRCYREFGAKGVQFPGALPTINPVTCLIGSGPVRDDLFDHLKPEYLKDRE
jgi:hypothetical protein